MAYNTVNMIRDLSNLLIPQYYDSSLDSYQPLSGLNGALLVNPTFNANYLDTTTALSASATYTGTSRDIGSTANNRSRFKVMVMHNASSPNLGYLVIEQSTDNSTFRETHRIPVPADNQYHIFSFPILLRYIRVKFINGSVAQSSFFLASQLCTSDTAMDSERVTSFIETTTALGASASFTGQSINLGTNRDVYEVRYYVFADQSGTLYVDASRDGSTWRTINTTSITANNGTIVTISVATQYIRCRYTNGATAQGVFELVTTIVRR